MLTLKGDAVVSARLPDGSLYPQWWRIVMGMKPIPNYPNHSHEDAIRANCESGVHRGCGCHLDHVIRRNKT